MNLFRQKKSHPKKEFDLVFFPFFHVRDRGLDRGARQDGFVFEKTFSRNVYAPRPRQLLLRTTW